MKTYTAVFATLAFCAAMTACDPSDPATPVAKSAVDSAKQAVKNTGAALKSAADAAKAETHELVEKGREAHVGEKTAAVLHQTGQKAKEVLRVTAEKTRDLAQRVKNHVSGDANSNPGHDGNPQK